MLTSPVEYNAAFKIDSTTVLYGCPLGYTMENNIAYSLNLTDFQYLGGYSNYISNNYPKYETKLSSTVSVKLSISTVFLG